MATSAIFRNLVQLACGPGQEIMLPLPYYPMYLVSAILVDAKVTFYNIDYKNSRVDMDSFRRAFDPDRTAMVVLNNPGNPLGNLLHKEEIIEINGIVGGHSFIVNDEVYNNCVFYQEYESPPSYLDERFQPNNIIINSFSKAFRMYTKRVGFAILPEPLIMPMRIMQQHTLLCSDPVNQWGMIEALKDEESPREVLEVYRTRAEYAYDTLHSVGCDPIQSFGGFYIVLDCNRWIRDHGMKDSKELAQDILYRVRVATVPGSDFGISNGLRLSFCNSRYNEAIDRLKDYFLH